MTLSRVDTTQDAKESIQLEDVAPVSTEGKGVLEDVSLVTEAEEKALVRKIDLRIMPLLVISYALQFFDKTTLGYTAILGIQEDTHLVGSQYSWVSSMFYFGYLAASYPASLALLKFPLGKFLSISVILWAIILGCHGAASNYGSLMALRFLLGVFESTISPGFSLVTAMWYKPSEHASRHGLWFAGNTTASIFGGLLAYAISHIKSHIAAWRWLFIIFALFTFVWGVVLLFFLPDTPLKARFLNTEQRKYAYVRPQQLTHSFKSNKWRKDQFIEAFRDPKTWFIFVFTFCSSIPNGGYTSFLGIIVQGFGFGTFETILLGMPSAAFGLFFVLASTYLAHKIKYSRCILMAVLLVIAIAGAAMVYAIPTSHKWQRLAGIWLFPAYAASLPLIFSIIASNIAGYTKKTTVFAIMFVGYCVGNIIGPQLFFPREAPRYESAFKGILICMVMSAVSILGMRQYMAWENRRRDREQGVHIDPEVKSTEDSTETHLVQGGVDETDWENPQLRYFL